MFLLLLHAETATVVVVLDNVLTHVVHAVHRHLQALLQMSTAKERRGKDI